MIVILKGGNSAEREVSLSTAKSITESLTRQKVSFSEIDAKDDDWLEKIKSIKPEIVVIALHGTFGEDGKIQKILQDNKIVFTGSDANSSALAFDKEKTKEAVAKKSNALVPKSFAEDGVSVFPVVVKPNEQGSSFGVSIVRKKEDLKSAIDLARKYSENGSIIFEEYIEGIELTCGIIDVFGDVVALPLVEIVPKNEFFDYHSKYNTESGCQEICPARIDEKITQGIKDQSKQIHKLLGLKQYSRMDWILKGNKAYFLEANSLPGMTPTSLLPKEFAAENIDYDKFICKLLS